MTDQPNQAAHAVYLSNRLADAEEYLKFAMYSFGMAAAFLIFAVISYIRYGLVDWGTFGAAAAAVGFFFWARHVYPDAKQQVANRKADLNKSIEKN